MMVEIDIEELFAGSMNNMAPVLPVVYGAGEMTVFDWPEFESFTSTGIAERMVYRFGECKEFEVDDFWESMDGEAGVVIRDAVNAGGSREIPLGARPTYPGDTLHLLDFEEDSGRDFTPGINRGLVMVGITSRRSVLLGTISDSVIGFNGLGLIEFIVGGQHIDRMA